MDLMVVHALRPEQDAEPSQVMSTSKSDKFEYCTVQEKHADNEFWGTGCKQLSRSDCMNSRGYCLWIPKEAQTVAAHCEKYKKPNFGWDSWEQAKKISNYDPGCKHKKAEKGCKDHPHCHWIPEYIWIPGHCEPTSDARYCDNMTEEGCRLQRPQCQWIRSTTIWKK